MPHRPRSASPVASSPRLAAQRLRIDRDGYDHDGAYWGAGFDVFILTTPDGEHQITVRARTVTLAREHAVRELRQAGILSPAPDPSSKPVPKRRLPGRTP